MKHPDIGKGGLNVTALWFPDKAWWVINCNLPFLEDANQKGGFAVKMWGF